MAERCIPFFVLQSEHFEDLYAWLMVRRAHHDIVKHLIFYYKMICQSELVEDLYDRLMARQTHHDMSFSPVSK
jgi:hypothetical protein